jgi:guanylate kinase
MAEPKKIVVIAGPSGSGKNAIIDELIRRFPRCARLVTATTRRPRPGEVDGVDYHFFSHEKFDREVARGLIPEHRFVASLNTSYGIYLPDLEEQMRVHPVVFAQVDIEGARLLKDRYHATTIFIMPESLDQFRARLKARNPEWSDEEFDVRIKITEDELRDHAPQYDYRVVNADGSLPQAVEQIVEILQKEGYTLA